MWLPRDERRVLEGYVSLIGNIDKEKWFDVGNLIPLLFRGANVTKEQVPEYGGGRGYADKSLNGNRPGDLTRAYLKDRGRVELANKLLEGRELIKARKHESETDVIGITLTLSGFDLGRRYGGGVFEYSGLWFEAYRNHWIWLIVSFVGGIIGGVLGNWLSR